MFIDFRERGREGGEGEGVRDREREMEREIDWLPLICALTRDQIHKLVCALTGNQTCNLLVDGMMG